jgi:hypothetical protein
LRNPKGLTVIPEERDAWAFLDAAAITSSRQQRAVIELVRGLKHAQLWTKMKAIYPFVGGTATTHKFNLKDPRDNNAAFRLSFSGGWTHASTGALPNGTNGYANTFLNPNTSLTISNHHISIYIRTDTNGTRNITDFGAGESLSGFGDTYLTIYSKAFSNLSYMRSGFAFAPNFSNTDARAFYILAKSTVTNLDGYKNTTKSLNNVRTSGSPGTLPNYSLYISAMHYNGNPVNYYDREISFASVGDDLTDTDATNLYNIVQRYQTSLGRQV